MKKMISIRNLIIIVLCIAIICMAIGFTWLSIKLSEKNNEQKIFDISFEKVKEETPVKGGTKSPNAITNITNQGKTLNMDLNLNVPHDELAYTITIKNNGTLPAEIIDIIETPDYTTNIEYKNKIYPVTISHNDIIGKVLAPEEVVELKVTAIYNQTTNISSKKISYSLSILAQSPKED